MGPTRNGKPNKMKKKEEGNKISIADAVSSINSKDILARIIYIVFLVSFINDYYLRS